MPPHNARCVRSHGSASEGRSAASRPIARLSPRPSALRRPAVPPVGHDRQQARPGKGRATGPGRQTASPVLARRGLHLLRDPPHHLYVRHPLSPRAPPARDPRSPCRPYQMTIVRPPALHGKREAAHAVRAVRVTQRARRITSLTGDMVQAIRCPQVVETSAKAWRGRWDVPSSLLKTVEDSASPVFLESETLCTT